MGSRRPFNSTVDREKLNPAAAALYKMQSCEVLSLFCLLKSHYSSAHLELAALTHLFAV